MKSPTIPNHPLNSSKASFTRNFRDFKKLSFYCKQNIEWWNFHIVESWNCFLIKPIQKFPMKSRWGTIKREDSWKRSLSYNLIAIQSIGLFIYGVALNRCSVDASRFSGNCILKETTSKRVIRCTTQRSAVEHKINEPPEADKGCNFLSK